MATIRSDPLLLAAAAAARTRMLARLLAAHARVCSLPLPPVRASARRRCRPAPARSLACSPPLPSRAHSPGHLLVAAAPDAPRTEGSQHRKQKFSYATSGINPKDLDLLDDGSEDEIQSLTLEERSKRIVDAGVGLSIPATRLI